MLYTLYLTFIISGTVHETQLKTFDRLEECLETASVMMRYRDHMVARCVLVEKPKEENK